MNRTLRPTGPRTRDDSDRSGRSEARAFSPEHGLMDFDPEEARVKRAIASIADKVVGLVDHSKWGRLALLPPVVPTSDLAAIVIDRAPADSVMTDLKRRGVQVLVGEGHADQGDGR
jgi:DeoR/GlpR family transcriptional regulator of sugar metabolism